MAQSSHTIDLVVYAKSSSFFGYNVNSKQGNLAKFNITTLKSSKNRNVDLL